jgi:hypothetical protein
VYKPRLKYDWANQPHCSKFAESVNKRHNALAEQDAPRLVGLCRLLMVSLLLDHLSSMSFLAAIKIAEFRLKGIAEMMDFDLTKKDRFQNGPLLHLRQSVSTTFVAAARSPDFYSFSSAG